MNFDVALGFFIISVRNGHIVLTPPDQQTAETSAFIETVKLADDQPMKCFD